MKLQAQVASAPRISVEGAKISNPETRVDSLTYEADKEQLTKGWAPAWQQAEANSADVNAMAELALAGRQPGGPAAPLKGYLTNLATSVGIELSPEEVQSANDAKLFEQIAGKLTPRMRVAGSGTTSDADLKLLQKTVPQITDTKDQQLLMALGMKQSNDWLIKTQEAVLGSLEEQAAAKQTPTLARASKKIQEVAGKSWLPRMTVEEAKAAKVPVLFLDKDSGLIRAWTPN
jgi:hypothetical protein